MIMIRVVNENVGMEFNYAETFIMLKDVPDTSDEKHPEIRLRLTNPPQNEGETLFIKLI